MAINQDINKALIEAIDHVVDALGDSSSPSIRAQILIDIDQHEGTRQLDIAERLELTRSTVTRHIDWLEDHGCAERYTLTSDARENHVRLTDYSKNHLKMALDLVDGRHDVLKTIIQKLDDMIEAE